MQNLRVNVNIIDRFIGTVVKWSEYSTQLDAVARHEEQWAARHKEQYRQFPLINHRRSSNLGFRTLRAEN